MTTNAPAGLEAGYAAATTGAGLVERAGRGVLTVSGPDAVDFLQGQVTNDVAALNPGSGCYAALLTPKARMLADARVLVTAPDRLQLDTEPVARERALSDLRMYKIGRDATVEDLSDERSLLRIVGPRSAEVAGLAAGEVAMPSREHDFVEVEADGQRVLAIATQFGIDVLCATSGGSQVAAALLDAGAVEISEQAAEAIRIEHGVPRYGVDMTEANLPGEAGIVERAVSFEKGCYVGQEPVARMFHKGRPNRHLRGLELSEPIAVGAALLAEEKEVGRATSTTDSPRLGPIAIGILRREAGPGDELAVADSSARATVIELPF